jgi:hypothetical protein
MILLLLLSGLLSYIASIRGDLVSPKLEQVILERSSIEIILIYDEGWGVRHFRIIESLRHHAFLLLRDPRLEHLEDWKRNA